LEAADEEGPRVIGIDEEAGVRYCTTSSARKDLTEESVLRKEFLVASENIRRE
jgi:hypothetical protein